MTTYEGSSVFRDIANAAVRSEQNTKFPARVLLTAGACESAWFTRVTGSLNYWGITRLPEQGHAQMCDTHEEVSPEQLESFDPRERETAVLEKPLGNGKNRYAMKRYFAAYQSIGESVVAYTEFFTKSPHRYTEAWQQFLADGDEKALLDHICKAGYATGDAQAIEDEIFEQSNIEHAISMAQKANGIVTT
jgi:flagellum-specific peptidoglycan hydrolase FlgJ